MFKNIPFEEAIPKNWQPGLSTLAVHAGQFPDPTTGAIIPPIYQTSTFVQQSPGKHLGWEYSRTHNPTRTALEKNLAALEKAQFGRCFASGCAATTTLMHLFQSGDHIICGDDIYGGTYRLFSKVMAHMGLSFNFVDLTDLNKIESAIQTNTKAIWVETPTNPLLKITHLQPLCDLAHSKNIKVICDNTFMTPIFQNPLTLGCDVVVHSTTKYINGHSDVIGGFAATNNSDLDKQIGFLQNSMGAIPSPMDSWLVLRGIKTLALRMKAHEENAQKCAHYLEQHPKIAKVIYPGLKSHPQHSLALSQMQGMGGMITIILKNGLEASKGF